MKAWITPPEDFQRDESKERYWKAVGAADLLDPILQFGRKTPVQANLQVLRNKVVLPTDIDLLVVQYCRTLGEQFSSPDSFDVTVTDFIFKDEVEGRLLNVVFPETEDLFPIQSIAFRLDEDQLTTAIYTTERSLISQNKLKDMGEVLQTLQAPITT